MMSTDPKPKHEENSPNPPAHHHVAHDEGERRAAVGSKQGWEAGTERARRLPNARRDGTRPHSRLPSENRAEVMVRGFVALPSRGLSEAQPRARPQHYSKVCTEQASRGAGRTPQARVRPRPRLTTAVGGQRHGLPRGVRTTCGLAHQPIR